MKYVLFVFSALLIISCEVENVPETIENSGDTTLSKTLFELDLGTSSFNKSEHADLLSKNAFVIGELMRVSFQDRQLIFNAMNPTTRTVNITALLNDLPTGFYERYRYIATHAIPNYANCGNPDTTTLWPPFIPQDPFKTFIYPADPTVDQEINLLMIHETEVYLPNNWSGNIFTVGHPLSDVQHAMGIDINLVPVSGFTGIAECIYYSVPASINTSTIVSNEFIVLSRPTSASISLNQYDYINFDIKKLLNKANLNGPGGTGIAL